MKRILIALFALPLALTGCGGTEFVPVYEPVPVFVEPAPVIVSSTPAVVTPAPATLPPPTPVP